MCQALYIISYTSSILIQPNPRNTHDVKSKFRYITDITLYNGSMILARQYNGYYLYNGLALFAREIKP